MIDRETRDLDCFGPTAAAVDEVAPVGFAKLHVAEPDRDETQVDLGFDPADLPAVDTEIGAVRALPDLAGDRLSALFARALPRDFVDVVGPLQRFTKTELLAAAAAKDRGFNTNVFADAFCVLATIRRDRFDMSDEDYRQLREVFTTTLRGEAH